MKARKNFFGWLLFQVAFVILNFTDLYANIPFLFTVNQSLMINFVF